MTVKWDSASQAEDGAIRALRDLCGIEPTLQFRAIGGVMQMLHGLRHPGVSVLRTTADADLGIEASAIAVAQLRAWLTQLGYLQTEGNRFVRGSSDEACVIDVLFPDSLTRNPSELAGVVADLAPGLHLALAREPLLVEVEARLTQGSTIAFAVPIPDSAMAVVLKVLAWDTRYADKDLLDLASLLRVWWQERDEVKTLRRRGVVERAATVLARSVVVPQHRGAVSMISTDDRALAQEFLLWLAPLD